MPGFAGGRRSARSSPCRDAIEAPASGQARQGGQGGQVRGHRDVRGARDGGARPEDNRPPVFFREEWKHQFDRGGSPEGPVGQEHVVEPGPRTETLRRGAEGRSRRLAGTYPCRDVDEQAVRQRSGASLHRYVQPSVRAHAASPHAVRRPLRPSARKSGGWSRCRVSTRCGRCSSSPTAPMLVGDHADGWVEAFDWYTSEILIASVRWRKLDPERLVTILGAPANAAGWVEKPD